MAKQTTSTPQGNPPARKAPAARPNANEAAQRLGSPNIVSFLEESRAELRKVTWPTREQTMNLAAAVIVMTVALSAFLGLIDYLLNLIIGPIIGAH